MRVARILVVASLCTPLLARAQSAIIEWPVAVGAHVRIESPVLGPGLQQGNIVAMTADTLVFRPMARDAFPVSIGTPNIARLEVATGEHARKAKGALVGLLIGAASGAALGAASYKKPDCTGFCAGLPSSRSFDAFVGAVLLGGVGAIVGAFIGARPTESWTPVAIPR
jgi:hypothetical protein